MYTQRVVYKSSSHDDLTRVGTHLKNIYNVNIEQVFSCCNLSIEEMSNDRIRATEEHYILYQLSTTNA